jgi:hypothetical protein
MLSWRYPRRGDAPAAGDAVGLGSHSVVQVYAAWVAPATTNPPARTATTTTTAPIKTFR